MRSAGAHGAGTTLPSHSGGLTGLVLTSRACEWTSRTRVANHTRRHAWLVCLFRVAQQCHAATATVLDQPHPLQPTGVRSLTTPSATGRTGSRFEPAKGMSAVDVCVVDAPFHADDEDHPSNCGPQRLVEAGAADVFADRGVGVTVERAVRKTAFATQRVPRRRSTGTWQYSCGGPSLNCDCPLSWRDPATPALASSPGLNTLAAIGRVRVTCRAMSVFLEDRGRPWRRRSKCHPPPGDEFRAVRELFVKNQRTEDRDGHRRSHAVDRRVR
jgi:hypothetical protein